MEADAEEAKISVFPMMATTEMKACDQAEGGQIVIIAIYLGGVPP